MTEKCGGVALYSRSFGSHQGSRVKLKNDMLHEDQQVRRPFFQLVYAVEVCALVIHCLKDKTTQIQLRDK